MKYAIISDIHSNLIALEAVLDRTRNVDKIICLGDIVGYGPYPNECIELLKQREITCIAGNHDKAVTGELGTANFTREAKDAILWTKVTLTKENLDYLKHLPTTLDIPDFQIVHGGLANPLEEYITSLAEATDTLEKMEKPLCFVGHSHKPLFIGKKEDGTTQGKILKDRDEIIVSEYASVIINVGAVGQPRDRDPRAGYCFYDHVGKKASISRVNYNVKLVQEKMEEAELPEALINRLKFGL